MRQLLALACSSSALAGCSLIYSPNNLPSAPSEAGIDAPSDAEVILDADPRMLVLDDVAPSTIYEGQGDGGSAPALVVIHGHHIIDNNTIVEITPTSGAPNLTFGAPVIARSGNWIAIPITAHVDIGLLKADRILLDVKVTESIPDAPGMTSMFVLHGKLALQGLSELVSSAASLDTGMLEPMYSKVDLSAATTTFTGTNRAIIHSMSSITTKALAASGGTGGTTAAMTMLVGGCAGGGPASTGGCNGTIGGQAGMLNSLLGNAGGGGGGGFATNGAAGGPPSGGAAGSQNGDPLIAVYDSNRSGGGGGGGKPTLGANGGGGGGGGGSIELSAGGDILVGAITANGGTGGAGSSGGGGGAGGMIMLRADGSLTVGGAVTVNGGGGGNGGGNNGNGGAGSPGRVRWDAQTGGVSAILNGTLHRGPTFTLPMRLFREPIVNISLVGTSSDILSVYAVNGGRTFLGTRTDPGQPTVGPDGTVTFHQVLEQGLSHLCVTVAGGKLGTSEADKCVDVAFLP